MIGELLERNKKEENKKYSIIHWHTVEPKDVGQYLVTFNSGEIGIGIWCANKLWQRYVIDNIIAWCKLSDIEPYKEEKK